MQSGNTALHKAAEFGCFGAVKVGHCSIMIMAMMVTVVVTIAVMSAMVLSESGHRLLSIRRHLLILTHSLIRLHCTENICTRPSDAM